MSDLNKNSDSWQSLKEGNKEALAHLYNSYFQNLFEYGMRICRDRNMVKDAIQDLFVKIWTNRLNLGEVKNSKAYLLVSLRSTIYNKMEKAGRVDYGDLEDESLFEMHYSPESQMIQNEEVNLNRKKLLDAIQNLHPRQKEIIYLRYFEDLDYAEIADVMHITVKASYKLSARAMDNLREVLNVSNLSLIIMLLQLRDELS